MNYSAQGTIRGAQTNTNMTLFEMVRSDVPLNSGAGEWQGSPVHPLFPSGMVRVMDGQVTVRDEPLPGAHYYRLVSPPVHTNIFVVPPATTSAATQTTPNSATLNGATTPVGDGTLYWFEYGGDTNYGSVTVTNSLATDTHPASPSAPVTGLAAVTTYHCRLVVSDDYGIQHGGDQAFTTLAPGELPTATTLPAYNLHPTTVQLDGTVDPGSADTTCFYEYGTDTSYGSSSSIRTILAASGAQDAGIGVSGLAPNTTYHCQLVASNSFGVVFGGDVSFVTPPLLPGPIVQTFAASFVTSTSAVFSGSVYGNGSAISGYFEYGTNTSYGSTTSHFFGTGNPAQAFTNPVTGLTPSTVYHCHIIAFNAAQESFGNDVIFTTSAAFQQSPPTVQTLAATSLAANSAVLNGNVNGQGDAATTAYFEWGMDTNYGTITTQVTVGGSAQPFNAGLTGLLPSTTYHYRMDANNTGGGAAGADQTFTTTAPASPPPTVQTLAATSVTSSGATLKGTVNPNGDGTHAYFQFGGDTSYGNATPPLDVGSGGSLVTISNGVNLAPSSTYHYRIVAYNAYGSSFGPDVSFTTSSPPQPPTVTTLTASNVTTTSASLVGNVNPNRLDTHAYFQWGINTNYGNATSIADVGSGGIAQGLILQGGSNTPATTYHFRVVAYSSAGNSYGADATYTTLASPPTVSTQAANNNNGSGTAILNAVITPNNGDTTAWFEWGPSSNTNSYPNSTPHVDIGSGTIPFFFTDTITISPSQNYRYHAVGINSGGTTVGSDAFFYGGAPQ